MKGRAVSLPAAVTAAVLAPLALAGCMQTATYGTGEMPEVAMFREISGGLLSKKEKKPQIAYQPRAPLVMPPTSEQLPEPGETAEAVDPNWPVDPNERRVASLPMGTSDATQAQAEYRRLKPLAEMLPDRPDPPEPTGNVMDNYYKNAIDARRQREQFRQAVADANGVGSTERRFLTDPPTEYRQPASTALPEYEDVKKKKKPGFFSRLFRSS